METGTSAEPGIQSDKDGCERKGARRKGAARESESVRAEMKSGIYKKDRIFVKNRKTSF